MPNEKKYDSKPQTGGQYQKKIYSYKSLFPLGLAFLAIITFVWFDEIVDIPSSLFGQPPTSVNWLGALIETVLIFIAGGLTVIILSHIIGERSSAEKALLQSEEIFNKIFQNNPSSIVITTLKNGKCMEINESFTGITGYSRKETCGRTLSELGFWINLEDQKEVLRLLKTQKSFRNLEFGYRNKAGQMRVGLFSVEIVNIKNESCIVTAVRDITERKHAFEAVRVAKELAESIIANARDGIVVIDMLGNFSRVNPAFLKMIEYEEDKIKQVTMRQITPEKWLTKDSAQFKKLLLEGMKNTQYEKELMKKDGSIFPVTMSASLLYDDKGEPKAVMAIIKDETERKKAEEELKKTLKELSRSNQELEQFAYIASHDLQEPLRMVASYTQLLATRYKDKLDKDAHEFIEYAVEGATRMQDLINGLLQYSRIGTRGKKFSPTDFESVVDKAIKNLKIMIEETGSIVTHDPLPTIMADDLQMIQLFQNLISNAIKFRSDMPPRVYISANRKGKAWFFSVRDNGIGLDPQFGERIFTIFQRLHGRNKYPGVGIGLTVCKRIVERHNGKIWVESKPGKGATFFFTIPETAKVGTEDRDRLTSLKGKGDAIQTH